MEVSSTASIPSFFLPSAAGYISRSLYTEQPILIIRMRCILSHSSQPVPDSFFNLLCYVFMKIFVQDSLFVCRIAEEGHFHQAVGVFGRAAEGKIKGADHTEIMEPQLKHAVEDALG